MLADPFGPFEIDVTEMKAWSSDRLNDTSQPVVRLTHKSERSRVFNLKFTPVLQTSLISIETCRVTPLVIGESWGQGLEPGHIDVRQAVIGLATVSPRRQPSTLPFLVLVSLDRTCFDPLAHIPPKAGQLRIQPGQEKKVIANGLLIGL